MAEMTLPASPGDLGGQSLSQRADSLFPFISAQAPLIEAKGSLTAETIEALRVAGFFNLWLACTLGGAETSPVESLHAIEGLSYADGSTGWVLMAAAAAVGSAVAYLPKS